MNEEQCSEGKQDLTGVEQGEREIGEILEGKFVFLQNLGYEILVATWSTRIDSVSFRSKNSRTLGNKMVEREK